MLLLRMGIRASQVLDYFSGQAQSSAGGQRTSQVPVGHTYISPHFLRVLAHGVNQGPSPVVQELAQKNGFNFHGGLEAGAIIGCSPCGQSLLSQQIQRRGQLGWLS